MSIRHHLDFKDGYYAINREERNLAAIFYHILLLGNNLKIFLEAIGCAFPVIDREVGIYFEYAYIRDLWNYIDRDKDIKRVNKFKRKLILDLLPLTNRQALEDDKKDVFEFNKYFGAVPSASRTYIQSPANWSMQRFDEEILDDADFLNICKFKWCFNAKPDIVIHTTNNTAICIEAKLESAEGRYPSNTIEKAIFKRRFGKSRPEQHYLVGQLSIQEKIMELLGVESGFKFLVAKKSETQMLKAKEITWKETFEKLDTSTCPFFIKEWLKRI